MNDDPWLALRAAGVALGVSLVALGVIVAVALLAERAWRIISGGMP